MTYPAHDPIGEVAEADLPDDAGETHEAERIRSGAGRVTHLDEVLGLVDLDRVPGEETGEEGAE